MEKMYENWEVWETEQARKLLKINLSHSKYLGNLFNAHQQRWISLFPLETDLEKCEGIIMMKIASMVWYMGHAIWMLVKLEKCMMWLVQIPGLCDMEEKEKV